MAPPDEPNELAADLREIRTLVQDLVSRAVDSGVHGPTWKEEWYRRAVSGVALAITAAFALSIRTGFQIDPASFFESGPYHSPLIEHFDLQPEWALRIYAVAQFLTAFFFTISSTFSVWKKAGAFAEQASAPLAFLEGLIYCTATLGVAVAVINLWAFRGVGVIAMLLWVWRCKVGERKGGNSEEGQFFGQSLKNFTLSLGAAFVFTLLLELVIIAYIGRNEPWRDESWAIHLGFEGVLTILPLLISSFALVRILFDVNFTWSYPFVKSRDS